MSDADSSWRVKDLVFPAWPLGDPAQPRAAHQTPTVGISKIHLDAGYERFHRRPNEIRAVGASCVHLIGTQALACLLRFRDSFAMGCSLRASCAHLELLLQQIYAFTST
jgi:hypothetical protein